VSSLFEFHLFRRWFLLVPFYRHAAAAAALSQCRFSRHLDHPSTGSTLPDGAASEL